MTHSETLQELERLRVAHHDGDETAQAKIEELLKTNRGGEGR